MKTSVLIFVAFALSSSLVAQKCFDMSVLSLMSKLEIPGDAVKNFSACTTKANDHNQTVIVDYGAYIKDLDTLIAQKLRDFNNASLMGSGGVNSQMPSAENIDDAKKLAETLKNMTPEQQKAWAMQQANQQMQKSSHPQAMQDDMATHRLVMQTYDLAVNQLGGVDREFAAKYRVINNAEIEALDKLSTYDRSGCPAVEITGFKSCSCVNKVAGKFWQKKVVVEDQYDAQKIALYQSYIVKIKGLVEQVDHNIAQLHYGEGIKSKDLQRMLFSSQLSAFGNAFDMTAVSIQAIHKGGADLYVNKVNSDKDVYDLSCEK